ncbi:MAG: TerB family tellurite resistance protein [Cyclobacteriaceae bacterium]|nr:TerB family tellurite resistance protein [Cyclobacteriaceae bacterium]UYN87846.1 MAG: TerB family tellurite resistance protein [Cyclobacteriaceae bacterium]
METTLTYKLALLHLVHLLVHADDVVDDQELAMLQRIREEEHITDAVFNAFTSRISFSNNRELYEHGVRLLNQCTDEEKLQVFAHLYKLAQADNDFSMKEVRLLFYSLEQTQVEFDDVVLIARMAS